MSRDAFTPAAEVRPAEDLAALAARDSLALLERGRLLIAEAKAVDDVKVIRDQAQAVQHYLRQQRYSQDAQRGAAELKLRAERRLGELLAETVNHNGSRGVGNTMLPTLPDGVSKMQSHRWQLAAAVPEEAFAQHVACAKAAGDELTTQGVINLARKMRQQPVASPPLPPAKYRCIVADPPWPMELVPRVVRPWQVALAYPTMTEEQLGELAVADLAAEDCHLYLWLTHKHLPLALSLAERWGFRYELLMTWVKNGGFTPFGSWMRTTGHVLFCRRGSLPLERAGLPVHLAAARREHSRKPDEFYDLVRQASPGPRIDLFSREPREGFDQWGIECGKFADRAAAAEVG